MKKLTRRIALAVLLAAMLVCATVAGALLGIKGKKPTLSAGTDTGISSGNHASAAAAAVPTTSDTIYDYEIHVGGTASEMATLWNEAVGLNGKVLVVLEDSWTATSSGFGSGSGFTAAGVFLVDAGKNITVDLNGKTLDANSKCRVFCLSGTTATTGGKLTICDSSGDNTGTITGGYAAYGGAILVDTNCTLTLNGGTIHDNKAGIAPGYTVTGGGIYVGNNSSFTMNGGVICHNNGDASGGYYLGGGVAVNGNGSFIMNGGKITNNDAGVGAGVTVYSNSSFIMNGGEISYNTAYGGGGAGIFVHASKSTTAADATNFTFEKGVNINGGTICHNTIATGASCSFGGAGIGLTNNSTLYITGGSISENEALSYHGGGIYVGGGWNEVRMTGGTIYKNNSTSLYLGAGIYVKDGTLAMYGGTVDGNTGVSGAGIFVASPSNFYMYGGTICNNVANSEGGGIYLNASSVNNKFYGGSIINNSCGMNGGGIYVPAMELHLYGGLVVTGNKAGATPKTQNVYFKNGACFKAKDYLNKYGVAPSIGLTIEATVSVTDANPYRFIMDITTAAGHFNDGNFIGAYFFSDDPTRVVAEDGSNRYPKLMPVGTNQATTLQWEYQLDNSTWETVPADVGIVRRPYDGQTITAVRYTISGTGLSYADGVYTLDATGGSTTVTTPKTKADGSAYPAKPLFFVTGCTHTGESKAHASGETDYSSGENGNPVFNSFSDVGSYGFSSNQNDLRHYHSLLAANGSLTIEIIPQDITVTIDDKTIAYGDTPAVLTSDAPADAGVTLTKTGGVGPGKHTIYGTGWTNKNYNITFANEGVYTITKRDVEVIINKSEYAYGSPALQLNQKLNNTAEADGRYIGGWRYGGTSATDTTKQFIAADYNPTNNIYPFKLEIAGSSIAEYTATESAASSFTFYNAGTTDTVKATVSTLYYNITFKRDGDTTGTLTTGQIEITKAKITVNPSETPGGNKTKYELSEVGTGKTVEIPSANIVLAGKMSSAADVTFKYTGQVFDSKDTTSTAPTSLPELDTTATPNVYKWLSTEGGSYQGTPLAGTTVSWQNTDSSLTKTGAGTYKVVFKLSAANHEDLVVDWTMIISSASANVTLATEKTTDGGTTWTKITSGNPVYGDTVRVAIDTVTPSTVNKADLTNYKIYYKGTENGGTANGYGAWVNGTDTESSTGSNVTADGSKHKLYGTTTAPTNAGTYTATLVPSEGDYEINDGDVLTYSLTIAKKKVNKAPADSATGSAANRTYTAADQTFTIKDFDFNTMELASISSTDMTEVNSSFTTAGATSRQLKAKDAGTYTVKFALKDANNYEWDSSITVNAAKEYELKLTIAKKELKVTFTSPAKNANPSAADSWEWEPGDYASGSCITYTIDQTTVMPASGTKEDVTVDLIWCTKPASGSAAGFDDSTYISTDGLELDISELGKGTYVVAVKLADDTRGDNVNRNYEIKVDEVSGIPTVCKQEFTVSDGTANVSSIGWKVQYTYNGRQYTEFLSAATLSYMLNSDGTPVEYKIIIDGDSLPEYIEVYASYGADVSGVSGFNTSGYKDAAQKNAGTNYRTIVALKIKDGNEYVFDIHDTTTAGYTKKTEGYCELYVDWSIAKGKLDTDKVVWGYTVAGVYEEDGTTLKVHDFRVVDKLDSNGNKIPVMIDDPNNPGTLIQATDEGGNPLYEKIYETDAQGRNNITPVVKSTGLPASVVTIGTYTGSGTTATNTVNQNQIGSALSSTVSFTLVDTNNFEQPSPATLEWRVTKQTVKVSGWDDGGKVSVGDKTYSAPVVKSGDPAVTDAQLADRVEYTYEYNGTNYTIADLWALADQDLENGGTGRLYNVKVTLKAKDGYQLDASQSSLHTHTTTIGYTGTPVTVTADTKTGVYGTAAVTLKLEAAGEGDVTNDTTLYEVRVLDKDGKDLGKLGADVTLAKLNAGKYTLKIVTLIDGYTIKAGQDEIEYTITAIELELPVLSYNPVFNGELITVANLLDENTLEYIKSGIIEVSGEGAEGSGFRDVADDEGNIITHTLVIKISDKYAGNYKWKGENGATASPARFVLTDDIKPETTKISDAEADVEWQIQPLMLTVANADWNLGGKNPKLNLKGVPGGTEYSVEYKYYTDKSGTEEISGERKVGSSAWVSAVLTGADVNRCNIKFADSVNGTNGLELATRQSHTVPKSGFSAFAGTAVSFLKTNWLWFVIGLAILLFLIILICIIKHRKKTKEIREEKKAKKEEEKQRREDEKRRREEEREAARAKQQAELELQKAKQEAELAKMRAGLGLGMGAAGMAMAAQQPQQQQMQPQMPMQPQQQPMMQQMPQYPQYMPQQMPNNYGPQPQYMQHSDSSEIRELKSEIASMRAEQRSDRDREALRKEMELEFTKFRADNRGYGYQSMPEAAKQALPEGVNNADMLGAVLASMVRNLAANPNGLTAEVKAELPQSTEETTGVTVNTPTVYPPDAVITTTTTVDTTKAKPAEPRSRDSERDFDIDGFYDTFDVNSNKH